MARVHPFQTNFTAGELSPKLHGQVDFKKYNNGVEILKNMIVFPQGGATRRYGSRFVCEVKNSANATRLIPFEFNIEQTYILEFGNQYIRFYKDSGQITEATKSISAITKANPAVVTAASHGYSNGDHVWINDVGGMTELNGRRFTVANKTTNTFELSGVNSSSYTTYTSGGTAAKVYEIATEYTSAQLSELQFAQSADVMYIVHPSHEPTKLTRTGHTSWSITDVDFEKGPYLDKNTTTTTLNPSAHTVGTGRTVVASSTTGVNGGDGFQSTDVGRLLRFRSGHAKITAVADTLNFTIEILVDLGSATASDDWQLGAYSNTTGFPRAVSFFEQRLVFAGSTSYPQTIWGSQSGIYENFDEGSAEAADAFIYTIAANKVNAIRWLAPSKDLIVGTAGSEFKVSRPTGEPLQPDNINIQQQTTYGVYPLRPIQIGNLILFVQRQQRKVRQFYYRFEDDAYTAPDMTILAEHITDTGIKEVDYAQEPDAIYWAVRNDGVLLGMTFNREEDVVAWHRHEFGGEIKYTFNGASAVTTNTDDANNNGYITISSHGFSTGDKVTYKTGGGTAIDGLEDSKEYYVYARDANTIELALTYKQAIDRTVIQLTDGSGASHSIASIAKTMSVASIPEGGEDQVWCIVKRRINGNIVQYVEYLDKTINTDSTLVGVVNGNSSSLTSLDHLEGESSTILIGDAIYPKQTVTSGAITISMPSTTSTKTVEVGLGYTSTLKTLRVEAGGQTGTSQGRKKRYNEVMVRLLNTVGATINGDQLPFRTSSTPMGQNIPEFTGDKRVTNLGWDRDGQITVEQTQPLPMTILGITGTLVTSD
ncbi:putative tail tubular protein B [uncultured Mediterranean phage uvMED]|nr:putative tail tubular protein B [uncultured Mediterranean phage uvMED]